MDLQRQMLQELMAPLIPDQRKDFRDADVCKSHLVAFCPYELFQNTKVDIGRCSLIHDDKLALEYRQSKLKNTLGYEYDLHEFLVKLSEDLDRQIKKGYQRLGNSGNMIAMVSQEEVRENLIALEAMAEPKLEALEHYGILGRIKEAHEMWMALEKIYEEMELVRQDDVTSPSFRPDKRMDICLVCGALLANDVTGQRLESHLTGKQHTGFLRVREALEVFKRNPPVKAVNAPKETKTDPRDQIRDRDLPERNPSNRYHRDRRRDGRDGGYRRDSRDARDSRDYSRDRDRQKDGRDRRDSRDSRDRNYQRRDQYDRRR